MDEEHARAVETPRNRAVIVRESAPRPFGMPAISWSAVFAGVFVVMATAWLLKLLGMAIMVSAGDAMDSTTMGGTLTPAASIWIMMTWLVSFFIGSLVTARLAGRIDDFSGMLHGLTLWAVSSIVTMVLAFYGMSMMLGTAGRLAGDAIQGVGIVADTAVSGVAQATSATASATTSMASNAAQTINEEYGAEIQDRLYEEAVEMTAAGTTQVSEAEIREAIESLDQRTLRRIVVDLTNNDNEGAAELLAEATKLSQQDAQALMDSAYKALEEQFGNPNNEKTLAEDIRKQMITGVDGYIASLDARGGPEVTANDVEAALSKMDAQMMQKVSMRLLNGDVKGAKRIIVQNTDMTMAQINELVDGATVDLKLDERYQALENEMAELTESATTYASQILWMCFAGSAAALIACMGGGYLGADCTRRFYPEQEHRTYGRDVDTTH